MKRYTSLDLQRRVGEVQETALKEPVIISHHGRDRLVIITPDEYERLKRRDKQVIAIEEMPDEFLAALEKPYTDREQAALDRLLD